MTQSFQPGRRKALKLVGGMPFLPLGATLASSSTLLAACGGGDGATTATAATPISVKFNSMAAPTAVADRAKVFTNATIDIELTAEDHQAIAAAIRKAETTRKRGATQHPLTRGVKKKAGEAGRK